MRRILIAAMVFLLISGGALAAKQTLRGDISLLTTDVTTGDEGEVIAALNGLQDDVDTLESGTIAALVTEDINCTDDALIADDLEVGGDLTVTGSASIGGGYIASGVVQDDLQMAAGKDLTCAAGASELDFSSGTGPTKTTTGEITIGGGTNAITLSGPVTGASAKDWSMVGASTFVIGSTGMDSVGGTINLLDAIAGTSATFSSTLASGAQTVTGGVTASGTVQGEQITSTDDMQVADDLSVLGDMTVAGSFGTEDMVLTDDLTVGDDADVVGDLTAGTITSDAGVTATGTVQGEQITSTDDATIAGDLTAGGLVSVNDTTVGGALDVDGATTLDGLTVAEASTFNEPITIDKADGTAPMVITSTTKVSNLNVDQVDGLGDGDLIEADGTQALTAAWDAGSFGITAETFISDVETGTAPFTVASTTAVSNLNVDQVDGKDSTAFCLLDGTQALAADWDVGDFDLQATDVRIDNALDVTGAATFTATVVAEDLNSTDDAVVADDLSVGGLATIGETLGVAGLTTVSAVAVGVNDTTTAEEVTLTSADLKTLYAIDASGATVTLTLPAADTVTGRLYMIAADADMGGYNIVLATTGGGKLGGTQGADTLTSTDATAAVQLISDGTNYQIVSMRGTWS
jgi:hypothetical protein